jgi:hypothetical protein
MIAMTAVLEARLEVVLSLVSLARWLDEAIHCY